MDASPQELEQSIRDELAAHPFEELVRGLERAEQEARATAEGNVSLLERADKLESKWHTAIADMQRQIEREGLVAVKLQEIREAKQRELDEELEKRSATVTEAEERLSVLEDEKLVLGEELNARLIDHGRLASQDSMSDELYLQTQLLSFARHLPIDLGRLEKQDKSIDEAWRMIGALSRPAEEFSVPLTQRFPAVADFLLRAAEVGSEHE